MDRSGRGAALAGRLSYNAIDSDPIWSVVNGQRATPYAWGSWWGGIYMRQLGVDGKFAPNTPEIHLAARSNHAIEAMSIVYRDGFYHLFASFDVCCNGSKNNYRIAHHHYDSTRDTGGFDAYLQIRDLTWTGDGWPQLLGPSTDLGGTGKVIVNQHSGLCLGNWEFNTNPGAEVRWYTCNNNTVQRWRFAWCASSGAA
ncbi:RICIN domain-containing protein [Saccharothrix deserti]|uniref:RICIN domain-containing protein n=1 Tax=Saccharothrix deserti TaxID=2593674 RepID=UPI00131BA1DC|nr:RICIN domain-containing protein [Saccharothrix deserti]